MTDDVFPLEPSHPLAASPDLSKSHSLLLYRGRMTGRLFDVELTTVRPGQEPLSANITETPVPLGITVGRWR